MFFSFALPAQGSSFRTKWKQFSQAKTTERFAPRGALSPYGSTPYPPRLGVKVGAGKTKYSGIIMFCRNAFGY